jgi:hypothetical protein
MSTDHRKPAVAFVALAFAAAALVGVQQADAQTGRFMAAVVGSDAHARGELAAASGARSPERGAPLVPALPPFARTAEPSGSPTRTSDPDDQVSRTHHRPPVPGPSALAKRGDTTRSSSIDSTERERTSQDKGANRGVRDRSRKPGQRGADRSRTRVPEHAAAHQERGPRPGHHNDEGH